MDHAYEIKVVHIFSYISMTLSSDYAYTTSALQSIRLFAPFMSTKNRYIRLAPLNLFFQNLKRVHCSLNIL